MEGHAKHFWNNESLQITFRFHRCLLGNLNWIKIRRVGYSELYVFWLFVFSKVLDINPWYWMEYKISNQTVDNFIASVMMTDGNRDVYKSCNLLMISSSFWPLITDVLHSQGPVFNIIHLSNCQTAVDNLENCFGPAAFAIVTQNYWQKPRALTNITARCIYSPQPSDPQCPFFVLLRLVRWNIGIQE